MWVAFFLFAGALNLFVAFRYDEATWVNFKLFGLMGLTLAFALAQGFWLARKAEVAPRADGG
jgi:intracellular septation protein